MRQKSIPSVLISLASLMLFMLAGCVTPGIAPQGSSVGSSKIETTPTITIPTAQKTTTEITSDTPDECAFDQAMMHMGKVVGDGILLGTYGAMEGALHGAIAGSASEGVIIGAAVGGAVGLGIGTYKAVRDYKPDLCVPS